MEIKKNLTKHIEIVKGIEVNIYVPIYNENGSTADLTGFTFATNIADWEGTVAASPTTTATTHPDTGQMCAKIAVSTANASALSAGIYRWNMTGAKAGMDYALYHGECSVSELV